MPVFQISSPDGAQYEVNAPDGATEQEALLRVQQQHANTNVPAIPGTNMKGPGSPPGMPSPPSPAELDALTAAGKSWPKPEDLLNGGQSQNPFGQTWEAGVDSAKNVWGNLTMSGQPQQNNTPDLNALGAAANMAPQGAGFMDRAKSAWQNTTGPQKAGAVEEALMNSPPGQIASAVGGTLGNIPSTLIGMVNQGAERNLGIPHQYSQAAEMLSPALLRPVGRVIDAARPAFDAMAEASPPPTSRSIPSMMNDMNSGKMAAVPPKPLPPELQALSNLPEATKNTFFASKPIASKVGLEANKAISASYTEDVALQKTFSSTVKAEGDKLSLPMPGLYDRLNEVISNLSDKVLPGSHEQLALSKIRDIRDNLSEKYGIAAKEQRTSSIVDESGKPIVKSEATPGMDAYGVSPTDLYELRTAINGNLNAKQFLTAGKGQLLDVKNMVNDGLKTAADLSPQFGSALTKADIQTARLGLYHSDSMKSLWHHDDYVAWKAKQNNKMARGVTDDTLSRANTFLNNLSNDKSGRASALTSILGKDASTPILRAAIVHAKKERPSLTKTAIQTLTGHPISALGTAKDVLFNPQPPSPLLNLAKDIRRMRK